MNVNHQIEIINKYISEWNPLGVPEEIADVEYLIYIYQILLKIWIMEKDCMVV